MSDGVMLEGILFQKALLRRSQREDVSDGANRQQTVGVGVLGGSCKESGGRDEIKFYQRQ